MRRLARRALGLLAFVRTATPAGAAVADDAPDRKAIGAEEKAVDRAGANGADEDVLGPFELGGRVFVGGEARSADGGPWLGRLDLESARLAVGYRWKERLRLKVSIEAAGSVSLRDGFLELRARPFALRAGRFKLPISAVERASAWTLPSIGRGAVAAVLEDGIALTGRRDGAQATWHPFGPVRIALAVSQSIATTGDESARPLADGAGLTATARAELAATRGVRIGVAGSSREVNDVGEIHRYWAAGVDLELDLADHGLPLRAWGDVLVGTSHLGAATDGDPSTGFAAAQAVVGWRFGGRKRGKVYAEPFARGGYLDPDRDAARDGVGDVAAGIAAGVWKRWRAQAQVSLVAVDAERPAGLAGAGADIDDETAISVQLGAAF